MTGKLVGPIRRCIQLAGVLLLVLLPLGAVYTHYRESHALQDLPEKSWRTASLRTIDDWVGEDDDRAHMIAETQGSFWSARILGWSLSDPLAVFEAVAASRAFYAPLWWSLLVPTVGTLLLGRVFCGWICPMNLLLEVADRCRGLLGFLELKQRDVRFSKRNKYILLALSLGLAALFSAPFLAFVYPPAVISRQVHLVIFGAGVGLGMYLILAIVAVELFVSRRWWCRYMCPGGALYSLLGRFRLVRISRNRHACAQCGDCVRACQFDLRPMLVELTGAECTNCGTCISKCASDALSYRFVLPGMGGGSTNGDQSDKRRATDDVTRTSGRPDEDRMNDQSETPVSPGKKSDVMLRALVGFLLGIVALPGTAEAHHILGLPHYSYKENYPQVPTLEYPATTGPYDVLMTSYPGAPTPGEAATVTFYVKNRQTGQVYDRPLTLRVLRTATFGSNQTVFGPESRARFDNEYKYTVTFPQDGEYIAELTMEVEGRTEVIPFLMIAGNPTSTVSILIAVGGGLLVFFVVVRAIKIKRMRRAGELDQPPAARAREPDGRLGVARSIGVESGQTVQSE